MDSSSYSDKPFLESIDGDAGVTLDFTFDKPASIRISLGRIFLFWAIMVILDPVLCTIIYILEPHTESGAVKDLSKIEEGFPQNSVSSVISSISGVTMVFLQWVYFKYTKRRVRTALSRSYNSAMFLLAMAAMTGFIGQAVMDEDTDRKSAEGIHARFTTVFYASTAAHNVLFVPFIYILRRGSDRKDEGLVMTYVRVATVFLLAVSYWAYHFFQTSAYKSIFDYSMLSGAMLYWLSFAAEIGDKNVSVTY